VSNARNTLFTIITVVVIPLLFFIVLEVALRVAGVGTHYQYFNTIDIDGQSYFQENPDFADQFYPPSLNVGPLQNTFEQTDHGDRLRVYVLGGSAAMGFPHKNHGVDRLLAVQLNALFPNKTVEVVNTAMTSVNSHVVYEVANTLPSNSADVAVVLMGNNEVVDLMGPAHLTRIFIEYDRYRPFSAETYSPLAAFDAHLKSQRSDAKPISNGRVCRCLSIHCAESDPRMAAVYDHFEENLRDISTRSTPRVCMLFVDGTRQFAAVSTVFIRSSQ